MTASGIEVGDIVLVQLPNPYGIGTLTGMVAEVFLSSLGNEHYDIKTPSGRVVARENHVVINYGPRV